MIYLIENPIRNTCKIGVSELPETRLAALQTGNCDPLRLRATRPGSHVEEKALHKRFEHLRVQGEWFQLTAEIMQYFGVDEEFYVSRKFISSLFGISGNATKVMLWMGMTAKFNENLIALPAPVKVNMAASLQLSVSSIGNALTELLGNNLIHRVGRGVYHLDPDSTWRGDLKSRAKNIQVYLNYTLEKP